MLKTLLSSVCLFGSVLSAHATISIAGDFGLLKTAGGAANVPVGGLLQLVASPSGSASNFSAPTATSFVSGDNVVVATFAMNYNSGTPGESTNNPIITLQNTGAASATMFDTGDPLLLRWYPTLTTSSTAPGAGVTYGEFRTDATTDGGKPWITPADGTNNYLLYLLTVSTAGNQPNTAGFANLTVAAVPEPGSIALMLAGGAGLMVLGRRKLKN